MRLPAFLTCLILGFACLTAPVPAQEAAESRDEIIELLGRLPEILPIREQLVDQGFRGQKLALAEDHNRRIMNDPVVAGYIADRLIALYDGNLSAASATEGLIAPLYDSGITRLPLGEMVFFHRVQRALMDGMTQRDCGLLVKGRLTPRRMEDVIGRAEARMHVRSLKEYYRVQRKAMRLGVSHAPKLLAPGEEARIQKKIFDALDRKVQTDKDARRIGWAFQNLNRADNALACKAGKMFSDTVLEMKGRDLKSALLFLSTP